MKRFKEQKADDCGGRREIARIPAELVLYKTRGKSYVLELSNPDPGGSVPWKQWRIPEDKIEDYCDRMGWDEVVETIQAGKGVPHETL